VEEQNPYKRRHFQARRAEEEQPGNQKDHVAWTQFPQRTYQSREPLRIIEVRRLEAY
jgi:hypothetical protein